MKSRILPLLLAAFLPALASARVLTLSNNPQNPGQYSTFADAQTAAVAGDTIYVHGSSISYNTINITKAITFIGPGHNPQKQAPLKAQFDHIGIGSSGIKVIGVLVNYFYTTANSLTNVTLSRNRIDYYLYFNNTGSHNNWIIEGNVFGYLTTGANFSVGHNSFWNFYFENNIFSGHLENNSSSSSAYNIYFNNCTFLNKSGGNAAHAVAWKNATYNNCIFYGKNPTPGSTGSGNTFNNCISYNATSNVFPGTGSGNLVNQDPLFTTYTGNGFVYTDNYTLQAGSPAKSYGLDGTDLGVHGGTYTWNQNGLPKIPYISEFTISNNQVSAGGSLNINFKSTIGQ
ncbi:hypothetical protein [Flaviaesturariibacter amylovorans]|uniref:Right-handed parallel beta-helix repeat-containing protein n=1 Tax=Flaviaesturariibacter amylovorans TaxID=1084520 RepID=A0ABP8HVC9_9BACT